MKKILLLVVALMFVTIGFAQQQLATLNHNDSITVYYGITALQQAHAAAENGDIITLSSGIFNGLEITKIVTIRGASMWSNDSLGIQNTVINGVTTFTTPFDTLLSGYVEGLMFNSDVRYGISASKVTFSKCRIQQFSPGVNNAKLFRFQFINCIIENYSTYTQLASTIRGQDSCISFINSVVFNSFSTNNANIINSVIHIQPTVDNLCKCSVYNSILYYNIGSVSSNYGNYCQSCENNNSFTCYYSIGCNANTYPPSIYSPNNDCHYFDVTNVTGHYNYNQKGLNTVFKYFEGTYTEGQSFELQDNIAETIHGDDSTQVGIYGGMFPFDPYVRNPLIRHCNVANRSTADGKLAVDIEAVSE